MRPLVRPPPLALVDLGSASFALVASLAVMGCGGLLADDGASMAVDVPMSLGPSLAIADDRTCFVSREGRVACWGRNDRRKLAVDCSDRCEGRFDGDPGASCCLSPTEVPGLIDVRQVALGESHGCALHADGSVSCWYGDGFSPTRTSTPSRVPGLTNVRQIVAGHSHTCARLADSTVKCWGGNLYGQLGDGTTVHRSSPTSIPSLTGVTQIAAKWNVSCARLADGRAQCWGSNEFDDIGPWWRCTGRSADGKSICVSPKDVPGVTGVTRISATGCALTEVDGLVCWSAGLGVPNLSRDDSLTELALLTPGDSSDPFAPRHRAHPIADFGSVVRFEKAWDNHCAVDTAGVVRCIRLHPRLSPYDMKEPPATRAAIDAPITTTDLAVARNHACALAADQTVRCWGANESGQLGDGTTTARANSALTGR